MSKDYSSGLFSHSRWQLPAWNYRGLTPDHALRSIAPSVYPACNGLFRSGLHPALWEVHDFAAESHQVLDGQFLAMQGQCYNPSVRPRGAFHHDDLKATSYDYSLQLMKLGLGTQIFEGQSLEKKFIVFDQSGSQRSMFISISSINSLSPPTLDYAHQTSPDGPLPPILGFGQDVPAIASHAANLSSWEESRLSAPNDDSEMHENTEDLEALLCSDGNDDDDDDEDEVASTGHSPSVVTVHLRKERDGDFSADTSPQKRRKINNGIEEHEIHELLADTASSSCKSLKSTDSSHIENLQLPCSDGSDEHSHSGRGSNGEGGERESELSSVVKKMRRDKIRKTVGILRDLLPGGMQKDATTVLDEAIHYLQSLKLKVRSLDPVLGRQI